jgi:hypothetical protein
VSGKGKIIMKEHERDRVEKITREAAERLRLQPLPSAERVTIHCTELPEDTSDSPIAGEWNFYRREVGRLLAEGQEGKWLLIKGERIIGIWDSEAVAHQVAVQKFLMQPVLILQILTREPVLRGPRAFRRCLS